MVDVSVVISCKNEAQRLKACVASLLAQRTELRFEAIFVDNMSTDETYSLARRYAKKHPRQIIALQEKRPGSPAARNRGAKAASGKIILFTDADCEFSPDWLERMSRPFFAKATRLFPLGIVSGQVISRLPEGRRTNAVEGYLDRFFFVSELERVDSTLLPWAPTCNLAIRRDLFLALGGLDESWRTAAYDTDLCWRALCSGFAMQHVQDAVVYHERRSTLGALIRQTENYAYHNFFMYCLYRSIKGNPWRKIENSRWKNLRELTAAMLRYSGVNIYPEDRPMDLLVKAVSLRGVAKALTKGLPHDKSLNLSRRGKCPSVLKLLPEPYRSFQKDGWWYWIDPKSPPGFPSLLLKNKATGKKFYLNATTWRIWEESLLGKDYKRIAGGLKRDFACPPRIVSDVKKTRTWLSDQGILRA